jgi:hypothetical protein
MHRNDRNMMSKSREVGKTAEKKSEARSSFRTQQKQRYTVRFIAAVLLNLCVDGFGSR